MCVCVYVGPVGGRREGGSESLGPGCKRGLREDVLNPVAAEAAEMRMSLQIFSFIPHIAPDPPSTMR